MSGEIDPPSDLDAVIFLFGLLAIWNAMVLAAVASLFTFAYVIDVLLRWWGGR